MTLFGRKKYEEAMSDEQRHNWKALISSSFVVFMILINSFFAKGFYTFWVFIAWENEKFLKIKKNHLFANILIIKILYKIILNQISRYITQLCTMSKSSRPEYYVNMLFLKISGKHLYQNLIFDKDVGNFIKKDTPIQVAKCLGTSVL